MKFSAYADGDPGWGPDSVRRARVALTAAPVSLVPARLPVSVVRVAVLAGCLFSANPWGAPQDLVDLWLEGSGYVTFTWSRAAICQVALARSAVPCEGTAWLSGTCQFPSRLFVQGRRAMIERLRNVECGSARKPH